MAVKEALTDSLASISSIIPGKTSRVSKYGETEVRDLETGDGLIPVGVHVRHCLVEGRRRVAKVVKAVAAIVDHLAVHGGEVVGRLDQLVQHVSGEPEPDVHCGLSPAFRGSSAPSRADGAHGRPGTHAQACRELLDRGIEVLDDERGLEDAVGGLTEVEEHGYEPPPVDDPLSGATSAG